MSFLLSRSFALPDIESTLFSGSGNCAFCHEQWSGALLDASGNNVSITEDWRATMMAHSFIDPFWRARMEAEVADRPELKEFIEDKCLTCHAPMARTQYRQDEEIPLSLDIALETELAHDGVSCTLCHQIQAGNLGEESSLDGGYIIGCDRNIYGPYEDVPTGPMRNHVDYTPGFGKQVQDSALCATCHTLFTPILDHQGRTTGLFPEQVPYLEWKNSIYPRQGRHCQDCHMPRLDEPVRITARPPWIGTRQPFWRHTFVGANLFMRRLMAGAMDELCTLADAESFNRQIEATRRFLREDTARLSVVPERTADELLLRVKVENLAGHKFPTGYPYRRAWLRVEVLDEEGRTLFLSGAVDTVGRLPAAGGQPFRPHYEEIADPAQIQVYQAVMGDENGDPTPFLLRAAHYLKDNRIPPKGFEPDHPDFLAAAVSGRAAEDPEYTDGSGCDVVRYRISVPDSPVRLTVHVELLYQPVPPEAVDPLLTSGLPAARRFARLYRAADKRPEQIQFLEFTIAAD